MTKTQFRERLEELARAWVAKDYERAAAFFSDDVQYADPLRYSAHSRTSY